MASLYEAPGSDLWDILGYIYILSLLLSPLFVRWRRGLRSAMYWIGAEVLIMLDVSALIYLAFYPDWQPLPRLGTGHTQEEAMLLIAGATQLEVFLKLTLLIPTIAIIGGAMLTLVCSALAHGWRSVTGRWHAG